MKTKLTLLTMLAFSFGVLAADAVPAVAPPADPMNWLNLIVVGVTPVVIALIKWGVPKVPGWTLPIAAPFVGIAVDFVLKKAGVATDGGVIQTALLGAAGVWLRELQDQVRQRVTPETPPTTTTTG
jgi:hypothetical protein